MGRASDRLFNLFDSRSCLLLDVGNEVEETASNISSGFVPTRSFYEGLLKIHHQTDRSIQYLHTMLMSDAFNDGEEALVNVFVLAFHQAIQQREGYLVLDKAMEHVELGEGLDHSSECPIGIDECRR